ncbi:MAG: hypothetical protein IJ640_03205 [Prevotella sp.]|nr:hypothetical protein [Prevotella sp.]
MTKEKYITPTTEVIFQMDEICQYGFSKPQTSTDEVGANETVFIDEEEDWINDFGYDY